MHQQADSTSKNSVYHRLSVQFRKAVSKDLLSVSLLFSNQVQKKWSVDTMMGAIFVEPIA